MSGYTKLFTSILASTIWEADMPTRIVWITMLAMKDKHGLVEASVPGLATLARVPVAEVRQAIENLKAPDPDSRTKVEEGRRIREVEGGWQVINAEKYRNLLSAEERREYLRIKQAEHRARKASTQVNTVNTHVDSVDEYTESTHPDPDPDPESEADPKDNKIPPTPRSAKPNGSESAPSALDRGFEDFWHAYPKKVGKAAALKVWTRLKPVNGQRERILAAIDQQASTDQWTREQGRFIPNPATWLNQGRWDDEPVHGAISLGKVDVGDLEEPYDWFEECKLVHHGACGLDRYKHALRLRADALKSEAV